MNENEMKERLAKGEDPLELSILKWEDIVYHGGEDMGFQNCALCDVYYRHDANDNFVKDAPSENTLVRTVVAVHHRKLGRTPGYIS